MFGLKLEAAWVPPSGARESGEPSSEPGSKMGVAGVVGVVGEVGTLGEVGDAGVAGIPGCIWPGGQYSGDLGKTSGRG